jgi:hypothetical protein
VYRSVIMVTGPELRSGLAAIKPRIRTSDSVRGIGCGFVDASIVIVVVAFSSVAA